MIFFYRMGYEVIRATIPVTKILFFLDQQDGWRVCCVLFFVNQCCNSGFLKGIPEKIHTNANQLGFVLCYEWCLIRILALEKDHHQQNTVWRVRLELISMFSSHLQQVEVASPWSSIPSVGIGVNGTPFTHTLLKKRPCLGVLRSSWTMK